MAKDKGKGKETKPSSETKNAAKAQDDAIKEKEAEAKDAPAFEPSKKEDPPSLAKQSADHIRFLVRQSLGFIWQHISCVHKCKNNPRLIEQINKNKDRQVSCFSALIAKHLVVRKKMIDSSPIFQP